MKWFYGLASMFFFYIASIVGSKGDTTGIIFFGASALIFLYNAWSEYRRAKRIEAIREKRLGESAMKDAARGDSSALIRKAREDHASIYQAIPAISERDAAAYIGDMQAVAGNFIAYLERNPEKIMSAHKFIDYYQDRAVRLVRQLAEIDRSGISSGRLAEARSQIKEILPRLLDAYEQQFSAVMSEDMFDLDAEMTVLRHTLDEDGAHGSERTGLGGADGARREPLGRKYDEPEAAPSYGRYDGHTHGIRGWLGWTRHTEDLVPEAEGIWQKKQIASLLGIFAGSLGAHKFYLGRNAAGIFSLMLSWTLVPGFLGFIEGMRMLSMPVEDFYFKYIWEDDE